MLKYALFLIVLCMQIVEMESDVLAFLKFEMGNPTVGTFLRRFIRDGQEYGKVVHFCVI